MTFQVIHKHTIAIYDTLKYMKFINSLYAIIISSAVVPFIALAQNSRFDPYGTDSFRSITPGVIGSGFGGVNYQTRAVGITSFESLLALAQRLLGYFQVIIFVVAIAMALYGAFLIVTKGDFKEGRSFLAYAFVGVVIAILSFSIIPIACLMTGNNTSLACYL